MKILKLFALAAITTAAFASFAVATASATELYNSSGMVTTGSTIAASAEGTTTLHPPIGTISCGASTVEGTTGNTGGASETVSGNLSTLTFTECNATVTVLKKGSLEIHTSGESANGNGTLTSSGTEVTVLFSGFHCIFSTSNTDLGTITGSQVTEDNATLDIAATIPRTGGSSGVFCGTTAQWTGSYKVTNPSTLIVDGNAVASLEGAGAGDLTYTVGVKKGIWWKNNTDSVLNITQETVHNAAVIDTTGTPCGKIASTATCKTREIKCLQKGETTITMISGKAVLGTATITCH